MTVDHLNVSEAFGPTLQGEGPNAGRVSSFLRLAGCNLTCSWCDTPYTWDWSRHDRSSEVSRYDLDALAHMLAALPGRVVVSGGEPLLQAVGLRALADRPLLAGRTWDVETNGTRPLGPTADLWSTIVVSPKVGPSARQAPSDARAPGIDPDDPRAVWKFVIADPDDLDATDQYVTERRLAPDRVWLMPEGTATDVLAGRWPAVAQAAVDRGWNATHRLHVLAWNDERRR